MKVDFVYDALDMKNRVLTGIDRKVLSQVDCINRSGIECTLVSPPRAGKIATLVQSLPFVQDRTKWTDILESNADAFYIRKSLYFSCQFVDFLERVKRNRPRSPILLEIPTYPYDAEMMNAKFGAVLLKDRHHRKRLKECVDAIVTVTDDKTIFGIPSIRMINGIDLNNIACRKTGSGSENAVDMICIASFWKAHGIDRMISGLNTYQSSNPAREVNLHLLGSGPAIPELKKMTHDLRLENHVRFYGQCNRKQMDEVFDRCSFAIEVLGAHRRDSNLVSSSLKSREYLAKGIPFVYSGEIDVLMDNPVDFCLKVPSDESPVDINELLNFHDWLYSSYREDDLIARIRSYAETYVSIDSTMKAVISYIKEKGEYER